MLANVRRYGLFVLVELAEPWDNFCSHGAPRIPLFEYQFIAPLHKTLCELQTSLFIHRVIGSRKNRDKQMKYTVLLAAVIMQLH